MIAAAAMELNGRSLVTDKVERYGESGMRLENGDIPPTYIYPGSAGNPVVADNYCAKLSTSLEGEDFGTHSLVDACNESTAQGDCETTYVHRVFPRSDYPGLRSGEFIFTECKFTAPSRCDASELAQQQHNCTWTHLMEDVMLKQSVYTDNCFGDIAENRRSLDGLLGSVHDTYDNIMVQNQFISLANETIRGLLEEQHELWARYEEDQANCVQLYNEHVGTELQQYRDELEELQSIARPDIRSAVNQNRGEGYQENAREGYNAGGRISQSLLQTEACEGLHALVGRIQQSHGSGLQVALQDCHSERDDLQVEFEKAYKAIAALLDEMPEQQASTLRAQCMNDATYAYKVAVEGLNGIDEKIQIAADEIHAAQLKIARLEPRFHDVEHAHTRLDKYLTKSKIQCEIDDQTEAALKNVQELIKKLQECPGRNDFVIVVPHWAPPMPSSPAPTPWTDRLA